jgi:cytochrome c
MRAFEFTFQWLTCFPNIELINTVIAARLLPYFVLILLGLASCQSKEEKADNDAIASATKPEDNRFIPVTITPEGSLDEPMMFQLLDDGTAYIIERKGGFKKFDPLTKTVTQIATIPVFTANEQGLIGLALDPDFENSHWVYLHYAPADKSVFRLERYDLVDDQLVEGSAKILIEIPVDRENTSHTGGGMAWDSERNLYITVGNNTGNGLLAQTDERPGRENFDDQRGASNTNDLRGKILRIHPEPDGTYTIPEGNLFPPETARTRPEIYTMGHRNAWRVFVDSKTGWIYWGEIGPDQDRNTETGPRGYDEHNQAKGPGFFGWPYFMADNIAIPKYDYANGRVAITLDSTRPVNTSPNNTGLRELPPAQPALIYYPYAASQEFPLVGSSSRCAIGGPVYHRSDFEDPERPFPPYYENKWLIADYSRFWIMSVTLDENGNYKSMERFAPDYHPVQPLDIKFGPDGDLYLLEYGSNPSRSSKESKLVRVEFQAGNRKPFVMASASPTGGALPLTTRLSAAGTKDYDNDELAFEWEVVSQNGSTRLYSGFDPVVTFEQPGVYEATLTARDPAGESNQAFVSIIAGNEPPVVDLFYDGNQTFFFDNNRISYAVMVTDREDGSLASGEIAAAAVAVSIDYLSQGLRLTPALLRHAALDSATQFVVAKTLINNSDCKTCHTINVKSVGPSFSQIAEKYDVSPRVIDTLAKRIIRGSHGVWGTDNNMPAHPSISPNDARTIVNYILSINAEMPETLPVKGSFVTRVPPDDNGRGTYIIRAAYTDQGANGLPSHTTDSVIMLRSPILSPLEANAIERGALRDQLDEYVFLTARPNSFILFEDIDLTDIGRILFRPNWHLYDIYSGGKIEIRLGAPDGELIGTTVMEREQFNTRYRGVFGGLRNMTPEQEERSKRYPPIDEKKFFAPGSDKSSFTIPSMADLKRTEGKHNVYILFKNDTVSSEVSLFPLAEIVMMKER